MIPRGGVVVVGDGVERLEQLVDILVLDEAPGEEHVVALLGEGSVLDLLNVDSVGDGADAVAWEPISARRSAVMPETAMGCCGVRAVRCSVNLPNGARWPRYSVQ